MTFKIMSHKNMNKIIKPTELIGKTIARARIIGHQRGCDSKNLLVLEMVGGEKYYIEGGYGGYTGKSCDEYYEYIGVRKIK